MAAVWSVRGSWSRRSVRIATTPTPYTNRTTRARRYPFSFAADEAHARSIGENRLGIVGFRYPLGEVQKSCKNCHQEEMD